MCKQAPAPPQVPFPCVPAPLSTTWISKIKKLLTALLLTSLQQPGEVIGNWSRVGICCYLELTSASVTWRGWGEGESCEF